MTSDQQITECTSTQPTPVGRKRSNTTAANSVFESTYDSPGHPAKLQLKNLDQSCPHKATLSGCSHLLSPPPSDIESTKSSPRAEPVRNTPSPTPSRDSLKSSSSGKSVRFSDVEESAVIGLNHRRYSPKPLTTHSKPVLKRQRLKDATIESEYGKDEVLILFATGTVDNILKELVCCVKAFRCPSQLDFSATSPENPLALAKVEKNKAFITQLQKLDKLRCRLGAVPTFGDEKLEQKHNATGMAIEKALERMRECQLKLYDEASFTTAVESALDELTIDLNIQVKAFIYPSELDFVSKSHGRILHNTERNQPFVDQLRKLEWFRETLRSIPENNDAQLQNKRAIIRLAIGRHIQNMREHQEKLYRRQHRA